MAKYRKKPIVVEAERTDKTVVIHAREGDMTASPGDYIITGINGDKYPCKPDTFEKNIRTSRIKQVISSRFSGAFNIAQISEHTHNC